MYEKLERVKYVKPSLQGTGSIPPGTEGRVLIYVDYARTKKLLVDFSPYGKAIVPLSSVQRVED